MKRILTNSTDPTLIAPCGLNCRLCHAYARDKNVCPGCRGDDVSKSKSCVACKIKNCEKLVKGEFEYCFQCDEFPCALLIHLNRRYKTKYGTSPIVNLNRIKEIGISRYVEDENIKWACPECGALICMHKPQCLSCGYVWHE
jgi:hypothetical protein